MATVIDLFSRRLLGYAMSAHHDAEVAKASLQMAVAARGGVRLIGAVGAPLLRLLAERSGLRSGLSTVLGRLRPDFVPEYDRGQVLIDVAVALGLGAASVAGATNLLSASQAVLGQVASTPTTWRALTELDAAALSAVAKARAAHRRAIWARLAARPGGFPWLRVAEQTWTGWIVIDADASQVNPR